MLGKAKNSPTTRCVKDIEERIARLEAFEQWASLTAISESELRTAVGPDKWDNYWNRLERIKEMMLEADKDALAIRISLAPFADRKIRS
jgi:hypothetical protein